MDIDFRLRHHYSGLLAVSDEQAEERDCTKQAVNSHRRAGTRHGGCETAPGLFLNSGLGSRAQGPDM